MMIQIERRRAPRTVLSSACVNLYSQKAPDEKEIRGRICDISRVGTKFSSNRPYRVKSNINLELLLPNFIPFTHISGRVVRCETKTADEFHTAVEFEGDLHRQYLVENYIKVMKSWENSFE
jgi:c-di-GMP-binding flagellar brake protein YcgR